jgi:small GTP-binding protein
MKTKKLTIWDTSGQEIFQSATSSYFRETSCAIILFDCTNENAFRDLTSWINLPQRECENCPFVLVCKKMDLQDKFDRYEE